MISRNGFRFSFVSYNILSQSLLTSHSHLYSKCNPSDLEWPNRGNRIVNELLHDKADIICLQEVENEHLHNLFQPNLASHGYGCVYKKRTGTKVDGCAIFYNTSLFNLHSSRGVEFNRARTTSILNRDNVGLIAVLKPKTHINLKSSQLVIANTHLIFNPRRSDIKLAQLKLFLTELEQESLRYYDNNTGKAHHHPTILCGDLNSLPGSEINRFILKNKTARCPTSRDHLDQVTQDETTNSAKSETCHCDVDEYLRELKHSFRFRPVYPPTNRNGKEYVSTFSKCMVDYIFYTSKLHLDSYKELVTEEELQEIGPIPNSEFPSDHLSLEASFILN